MINLYYDHTSDNGAVQKQLPQTSTQTYTHGRSEHPCRNSSSANGLSNGYTVEGYSALPDVPADGLSDGGNGYTDYGRRQQYLKHAKRTLHLTNLPDGVMHSEVTDVVRGGILLDVYIRSNDRVAAISFLEEKHAQAFFQHIRRNDLHIRGRRVSVFHRRPYLIHNLLKSQSGRYTME